MRIVLILIYSVFFFVLMTGCRLPELKPDYAPAPGSRMINQARLEFTGCGASSLVGTIACGPDKKAKAVTEFPGRIVMASSGAGCSLRKDLQATPPATEIDIPERGAGVSCAVVVLYLPTYPTDKSTVPTESLFGEVVYMPDAEYVYQGNRALTTFETMRIKLPGSVRGAFVTRQLDNPVPYTGDTLTFRPRWEGTDLILVKTWDKDNKVSKLAFTTNYYSPSAQQLTYKAEKYDDGSLVISFSDVVSIVTINGKGFFDTQAQLDPGFKGYVRAYTAQGRTLVLYVSGGKVRSAR